MSLRRSLTIERAGVGGRIFKGIEAAGLEECG